MGAVAYDLDGKPERPPWGTTIWAVLRGYLFALILIGIAVTMLWYAGVPLVPADPAEPGPWAVDGPWSLIVDAALFVGVVVLTSFLIHGSVRDQLGRRVSLLVVRGLPWEQQALVGTVIRAREKIRISFAQHVCPLDAVVRFELAGRRFTQRFVLDHC